MAVIGDILVKLVGDFAEFTKGMDENSKKLEEFANQATATNQKIEGFIGGLKELAGAIGFAAIAHEIQAYADKVQEAAAKTAQLAASMKLTTDQVQALQVVADKTGQPLTELAKIGQQNRQWLDDVTEAAKRASLVMDGETVRSLANMKDAADESSRRMEVLFAKLSTPIKLAALDLINAALKNINDSLIVLGSNVGILDKIGAAANIASGGLAGARTGGADATLQDSFSRTNQLLQERVEIEARLAINEREGRGFAATTDKKQIDDINRSLEAQAELRKRLLAATPTTMPEITVSALRPTTGGGGGGGKTDDDYLAAQIARYNALRDAAQKAYGTIAAGNDQMVDDLKRQVTVQQQVDDIAGKLGAKWSQASDAQKKALYDAVSAAEQARAATQKLLDTEVAATETQTKYGEGTEALAKLHRDLNQQLATRRLTTEAATRADTQQTEAIQQQALAMKRYDDNLGSLGAGFQSAANQAARSNDLFAAGGNVFNGVTSAMVEGLDVLAGKSNKTFGDIASDFALMLAKMAAQAALSQVFKAVFGALNFGVTADQSAAAASAVPTINWMFGMGAAPTGRAGGGDVDPGNLYRVNELGAEYFMPKAAGTIAPAGSGQSGDITVNVDMGKTTGARDASSALDFGRKVKAAVADVIANEKRPGGSLYQRLSN